jgi:CubicO group peptidase (beta-lactamase class C family)
MMRDLMEMYDVPGTALAIVKDGEVLYAQGYGLRDTQTQAPVTPDSLFALASVTKSFTALGVMQLVQAGKLDLDVPIITYLPDFKLSDANATQTLTLRHILSHTSGLPRADNWVFDNPASREEIIKEMADIDLTTTPGTLWQYNNQNYVLAGYLIEKVTGMSWENYTRQHIFAPLGMSSANFDAQLRGAKDFAEPHSLDILKGQVPIPLMSSLGPMGPAGSINASVADMARYVIFQLGDGRIGGKPFVSTPLLREMHAAHVTMPDSSELIANPHYGYGWYSFQYRGADVIEHDGGLHGFISKVTLFPSANAGVVLLSNTSNAALLQEAARIQLGDLLLGLEPERDIVAYLNKLANYDPGEVKRLREAALNYKPAPGEFDPLLGAYDGNLGISVEKRGQDLWMIVAAQNTAMILLPIEKHVFVTNTSPVAGTRFTFKVGADGTITIFQRIGGQDVEIAQRLGKGVESVEVKEPGEGRFSLRAPKGLVAQTFGNNLIFALTNPNGAVLFAASQAKDDPLEVITAWVQQFDPSFTLKPSVTTRFTAANGLVWQQYEYPLPSDQTFVVRAMAQDGVLYHMAYQMKTADRDAIEQIADDLLATFAVTVKRD